MSDEHNQNDDKKKEMEELLEAIKKLELENLELEKKNPKKRRRPVLAIEFGGVFHRNRIVNFVFNFIINLTIAYFIIEVLNFAEYSDIIIVVSLMFLYTILEEIFRLYVMMKHFKLVMRSIGTVFYFGYVLIFFLLDRYVFTEGFDFTHGSLLVFFVLIFTLLRYFFGQSIRTYFRRNNMR